MIQSSSRLNSKQGLWQPVNIELHQYLIWEDFKFSWNWLDVLWVGGWPYGVSVLNNRWPQIRFILRGRQRKERWGGGGGGGPWQHRSTRSHANKTSWAPLKRGGNRELQDWKNCQREWRKGREWWTDEKERVKSEGSEREVQKNQLQCSLNEEGEQILDQNKFHITGVWLARLKQNSIFTWGKTDITNEGAKDVRACHSLGEIHWNKTRNSTVLLQPSPLLLHALVHPNLLFVFYYPFIICFN